MCQLVFRHWFIFTIRSKVAVIYRLERQVRIDTYCGSSQKAHIEQPSVFLQRDQSFGLTNVVIAWVCVREREHVCVCERVSICMCEHQCTFLCLVAKYKKTPVLSTNTVLFLIKTKKSLWSGFFFPIPVGKILFF